MIAGTCISCLCVCVCVCVCPLSFPAESCCVFIGLFFSNHFTRPLSSLLDFLVNLQHQIKPRPHRHHSHHHREGLMVKLSLNRYVSSTQILLSFQQSASFGQVKQRPFPMGRGGLGRQSSASSSSGYVSHEGRSSQPGSVSPQVTPTATPVPHQPGLVGKLPLSYGHILVTCCVCLYHFVFPSIRHSFVW